MIKFLQDNYGGKIYQDLPKSHCHKFDRDSRHTCLLPERMADYFIFALVRNPYALEVSKHNYWPTSKEWEKFGPFWSVDASFSEYLYKHSSRSLSMSKLYLPKSAPKGFVKYEPDMFYKIEWPDSELLRLPFVDKPMNLPYRNHKVHKASSLYTNPDQVDFVYNLRKDDFDNFGYGKKLPWRLWTAKMY
jgi:hypothetical protein